MSKDMGIADQRHRIPRVRGSRALAFGIAALAALPATASARSPTPMLRIGAYVQTPQCDQALYWSIMRWDGRHFHVDGLSDIVPHQTGRMTFTGTYKTNFRDPAAVSPIRFVVRDRTHFTTASDGNRASYHFCPNAALPAEFRGRTR